MESDRFSVSIIPHTAAVTILGQKRAGDIVNLETDIFIVSKLLNGCEDVLLRHGVQPDDIAVAWVPGAFEIPLIASKMAKSGKYDAVIALAPSSVAPPATTTMCAAKYPRVSPMWL